MVVLSYFLVHNFLNYKVNICRKNSNDSADHVLFANCFEGNFVGLVTRVLSVLASILLLLWEMKPPCVVCVCEL